jgi:exopolysaccharide biosynthesis protein
MSPEEFDYDTVTAAGAYQIWTWGPMLLDDGQPMTEFNMPDTIGGANPRSAVGYFEPCHYCFVLVDGGQGSYSEGLRLPELSQLMYDLGCTEAYNLDGGHSSEMAFFGEFVNHPEGGGRRYSDIVYIGEE